jgi:hypothetical protein
MPDGDLNVAANTSDAPQTHLLSDVVRPGNYKHTFRVPHIRQTRWKKRDELANHGLI